MIGTEAAGQTKSLRALLAAMSCAALLATLTGMDLQALWPASDAPPGDAERAFGRLPAYFEPNLGQIDPRADFSARGPGWQAWFNATQAMLEPAGDAGPALRMRLVGADARAEARTEGPRGAVINYLRGDPDDWITGVPTFARVAYSDVYPGIDVVYSGARGNLRYDFVIAPGADPAAISLVFEPGGRVRVDGDELVVQTRTGTLRHEAPYAYQDAAGKRRKVDARFRVEDGRASFEVGHYDRSKPLIIDPTTRFATLLGGGGTDSINGMALGADGSVYLAGQTNSVGADPWPTTASAFQIANAGSNDAFVTKLNSEGTQLVYSTYIGGTQADVARSILVDAGGAAHVAGDTASTDFPTVDAFQSAKGAGTAQDAFVLTLDAAGSALEYSTYLGGAAADQAFGIAMDATGDRYITGLTRSDDFPTANAFQGTRGPGAQCPPPTLNPPPCPDAFVAKLDAAGSTLEYSTYLGGTGTDQGNSIAVDAGGNAFVAGVTQAEDFPTADPLQSTKAGATTTDAFVAKVAADGSSLTYSTYLGGAGNDEATGIEVDGGGRAHLVGGSTSDDFPTVTPIQAARAGETDAVVAIVDAGGTALDFSTFFGGPSGDSGNDIALRSGKIYIAGSTNSAVLPAAAPVAVKQGNSDAYIARLDPATQTVEFSSPYGGNAGESGLTVGVDAAGAMYLAGSSVKFADGDFPAVDAIQANHDTATDAFVAKIAPETTGPDVTGISPRSGPVSGGTVVTIRGANLGGATQVLFGSTPAPEFQIDSATQITAVSPESAGGAVDVRVVTPTGTSESDPAGKFVLVDGFFQETGGMVARRWGHTATLLDDGRVLVAGGRVSQGGAVTAGAEVYDPVTGTWAETGSLNTARHAHTATLLPNGRVLVAGGFAVGPPTNEQPNLDTAEIWNPGTGQWTVTDSLSTAHALHSAVVLDGPQCDAASPPEWCGDVLVAGGRTWDPATIPNGDFRSITTVSEIYDVATGQWTATGSLNIARHTTAMTVLDDGRVLIPAGFGAPNAGTTAELYDPETATWTRTTDLNLGRARQGAIKLHDGRVLVVGGFGPGGISAEIFDPDAETWTSTGPLTTVNRFNWYSAVLPDGEVLIAGGGNGGSHAEIYNPGSDTWRRASVLSVAHGSGSSLGFSQDAILLSSSPAQFEADTAVCGDNCGKVLITGNSDDPVSDLYLMAPEIDAVDVTTGPATGGTEVAITGLALLDPSVQVLFGDEEAEVVSRQWDEVVVRTPAHAAGSVPITVRTQAGEATADDEFRFVRARHARSISLELRRHLRATGRLTVDDGFNSCRRNVPVLIQRRTSSGWKTVGRDRTNRRGFYADTLRDRTGRYRARVRRSTVGTSHVCKATTSRVRRHRH